MFKDHFSPLAAQYARHRPEYPASLFSALANLAPARRMAWDCATGTGQAARGLAVHFKAVCATDASRQQLARAQGSENVVFVAATADTCPLPDRGADLVTVAQALHWFDLPAFYTEVRRVLAPGGVIAVWSYPLLRVSPQLDPVLDDVYHNVLGPFWPPERRHVETGYRQLSFPFAECPIGDHEMIVAWSLADLVGYIGTWSALGVCQAQTGSDPLPEIQTRLGRIWGPEEQRRTVRWPLQIRVGRHV